MASSIFYSKTGKYDLKLENTIKDIDDAFIENIIKDFEKHEALRQ